MINKIAKIFGVIFIVFTGIAAIISYELNTTMYTSAAPAIFIAVNILTATLPFLVSAVLSFSALALISSAIKKEAEKETETQRSETEAKQEAEFDKTLS